MLHVSLGVAALAVQSDTGLVATSISMTILPSETLFAINLRAQHDRSKNPQWQTKEIRHRLGLIRLRMNMSISSHISNRVMRKAQSKPPGKRQATRSLRSSLVQLISPAPERGDATIEAFTKSNVQGMLDLERCENASTRRWMGIEEDSGVACQ